MNEEMIPPRCLYKREIKKGGEGVWIKKQRVKIGVYKDFDRLLDLLV